jgi:catechol 2,3-dioxygenase-like lactoylglutathione lyase family enzyme
MLTDARIVYLYIYVGDLERSRAFYEDTLGLRVIESGAESVDFDGGQVILTLKCAADYSIGLPQENDNSADVVFLVDDLKATRAALEGRGVKFKETSWYQVGGIADFYDPDRHWLSLYEPSEEAMAWPSGDRIRAVQQARGRANGAVDHSDRAAPSASPNGNGGVLDGSDVFYVFVFVPDIDEALGFYHDDLGLIDLEGGPCSDRCSGDEAGVVKYDTGGLLMSTHHIDGTRRLDDVEAHTCPPRELEYDAMASVAPAFHVRNVKHVVRALSHQREDFTPTITTSDTGVIATCVDPSGHLFFLYEPSEEALRSPSGAKIQEILTTPL